MKSTHLFLLLSSVISVSLWPQPTSVSAQQRPLQLSFCDLRFQVDNLTHITSIINFYRKQVFKCVNLSNTRNILVDIQIPDLLAPLQSRQGYNISLGDSKSLIQAKYYPGFVRAIQTLSQLFNSTHLLAFPVSISDSPDFQYRGLMIDSSRHFLSKNYIKRLCDQAMFNKLNVLHWHITDQDSFPIDIDLIPQISRAGSFRNRTYSSADVRQIVSYCMERAVRVIPQIDTPAHSQSWGRSLSKEDFVMTCQEPYFGQFDASNEKAYNWSRTILQEINSKFQDPYVHLGGDQVDTNCWKSRPAIKTFMDKNNIKDYQQLQVYFRQRQKKQLRQFSNKTVLYWANQWINLPVDSNDVIHWWGAAKSFKAGVGNRTNKIVISFYDIHYNNYGFGGNMGQNMNPYHRWEPIFQLNYSYPELSCEVIGAVCTMWGEVTDQYSNDQRFWLRGIFLAQRLWNNKTYFPLYNRSQVLKRAMAQEIRLRSRGVRVMPVTTGIERKRLLAGQ